MPRIIPWELLKIRTDVWKLRKKCVQHKHGPERHEEQTDKIKQFFQLPEKRPDDIHHSDGKLQLWGVDSLWTTSMSTECLWNMVLPQNTTCQLDNKEIEEWCTQAVYYTTITPESVRTRQMSSLARFLRKQALEALSFAGNIERQRPRGRQREAYMSQFQVDVDSLLQMNPWPRQVENANKCGRQCLKRGTGKIKKRIERRRRWWWRRRRRRKRRRRWWRRRRRRKRRRRSRRRRRRRRRRKRKRRRTRVGSREKKKSNAQAMSWNISKSWETKKCHKNQF